MRTRLNLLAVLLVFTLGCGDKATEPQVLNIAGIYTANWTSMSGSGYSCNASGVKLELNQSGDTFTGTYSAGSFSCNGTYVGTLKGTVVNGKLNDSDVHFDLDSPDFHQTGTVSGNSLSGSATWTLDFGSGPLTLTGSWAASK